MVENTSKQPARSQNVQAIVEYFKSGVKPMANAVGIELEHTLLHQDGQPVSYDAPDGQRGILEKLTAKYPEATRDESGNIILLSDGVCNVTLEPAAQVEASAGPFTDLHEALARITAFEEDLDEASEADINVMTVGYHPTMQAVDLTLIPKKRYAIMNEYLGAISMFGICMMRGSASTQVSLDYTSEADCLRKLRLANALVPVLSLICDNAPVFEAAPRKHQLVRTEIWQKCDPDRCGLVPGVLEEGFSLEDYAAYILDAPALVDISQGEPQLSEKTFGEIYADAPMAEADVEHALSMFFTDVRLKRYIEIRPADALPAEFAVAYAALLKGLFYSEDSLNGLDQLLREASASEVEAAKDALMESGYEARVFGYPVAALADQLISLAAAGLEESERELLKPLAVLVASRVTLADLAQAQAQEDD